MPETADPAPAGFPSPRGRLRDHAAIRRRAAAMLRRRLAGYTMAEVAAAFGLTARHVRRGLAGLAVEHRRDIERRWRDDLLGPGGWRLLRRPGSAGPSGSRRPGRFTKVDGFG